MKKIEDLIKWIIIIWIAYPVISIGTYFSGNGRQLFSWGISAIICAFATVSLAIIHLVMRHKENNKRTYEITYEEFTKSLDDGNSIRLQYREFEIDINNVDNKYICKIYKSNSLIQEKNFSDSKTLLCFPFVENKTIKELWEYSDALISK